jgi:hypothetical protein
VFGNPTLEINGRADVNKLLNAQQVEREKTPVGDQG